MNRVDFEIMGLPQTINAIGRKHWSAKMREAKKWKEFVALSVRGAGFCGTPFPKAKLTLIRFSSVEPDFDNLASSFKHVVDGLVYAGLIPNDKPSFIGQPIYLWEKCSPRGGKIRVIVERVDD